MKPKYLIPSVLVLFALIQLIPVSRTNPPVESEIAAPEQVKAVLRRACYDCHSNETRWPGYSRVAPASWLVAHDVKEARENVNFSVWGKLDDEARINTLTTIAKEVGKGDMPLFYYVWMHPDAKLSEADGKLIVDWARSSRAEGR